MLTHAISWIVAPRLPAICGSATLMIVVSSTSMIAAVIRPSRMSQRYSSTSESTSAAVDGGATAAVPSRIAGVDTNLSGSVADDWIVAEPQEVCSRQER